MPPKEIEVKFLEINVSEIFAKLKKLGAQDEGEDFLRETIFYDKEGKFIKEHKFVRIRERKDKVFITYKHPKSAGKDINSLDDVTEIEFMANDANKARLFLEELGLAASRKQEKKRHTFRLGEAIIDIDSWPSIPTYLEIEGSSEAVIKEAAQKLGLDWGKAFFGSTRDVLEKKYNIRVAALKSFTFTKIE